MSKSINLNIAKKIKNDEFYTKKEDIIKEISHYPEKIFFNKTIFCNCDKPGKSFFYDFFKENMLKLNIKEVVFCYYNDSPQITVTRLINNNKHIKESTTIENFNGDFRDPLSVNILIKSDIIISNPPFSLFREYIDLIIKHNKDFIVVGSLNAITYKNIFYYIKNNQFFIGKTFPKNFLEPSGLEKKFGNICWFSSFNLKKEPLIMNKSYIENEEYYPKYDNYNAIDVSKIKDIPYDYNEIIGVPITYLIYHDPNKFIIVGETSGREEYECRPCKRYIKPKQHNPDGTITNGSKINTRATLKIKNKPGSIFYSAENIDYFIKIVYSRILIKRAI